MPGNQAGDRQNMSGGCLKTVENIWLGMYASMSTHGVSRLVPTGTSLAWV